MKKKLLKCITMLSKNLLYGFIFQLMLFNMLAAMDGNAQVKNIRDVYLNIGFEERSLKSVFNEIEKNTEYKFVYRSVEVSKRDLITVTPGNRSVSDLLVEVGRQSGLQFRQVNNNINVQPILSLGEKQEIIIEEQTITITGRVTSSDSPEGLPGVNVVIRGTSTGTVTDINGNYSINVTGPETVLAFSSVGYLTENVTVGNRNVINLTLTLDVTALEEIVVVGYGTQRKRDLTGSVASVKPDEFSPGVNVNAVQLLNGAVAGVNVSQVSSAPGGGIKIQIRGAGSINSSNAVLFVVDGLPGVDPQALSPDDIESIEVLKDASAAAIYGTRAANGVVLITTKKGRVDKPTFTYNNYFGTQSISEQVDVLGASDYMRLVNLRTNQQRYSEAEINAIGEGTNWQNEIFRRAPVQNHQLSFSDGTAKGNYYVGLNYFDQDGIVNTSGYKKYNARINVQSMPSDKLTIGTSMNFTHEKFNNILFSNAANENAGPINSAIQFDPTLPTGLDNQGFYYLNPTIALDNPIALINGITNLQDRNQFYGSLTADYEILNNLKATIRLGASSNSGRTDFYRSRVTQLGRANGGIGNVSSNQFSQWLAEYLLTYNKSFGQNHNFSMLGGVTFEEFVSRGVGASSAGFLSDVTNTNLLQSGDGELRDDVSSFKNKNTLNGFLGRATYGFKDKFHATASFRVDGSSRFSKQNRYAFFPSGSVAWTISEEAFMQNISSIEYLKLRVGYGELGNQGINNFETIQTLVAGGNAVFGGSIFQGVLPARLPNPDLRWETTKEFNVGLDFSFIKERISGSVDFFNRRTVDQLFVKPLPSVVGFTSVRTNFGEVLNRGVEIGVKTQNLVGEVKWKTNWNFSFLKNEVTKLPDFTQQLIGGNIGTFINNYTIVQEGSPLFAFYGYEIDGIFQLGDDIASAATPPVNGYRAGMPRFVDQNNDGVINDQDRVVIGDPFPDFSFGINNSLSYKRFTFDVFVLGVQGIETLDANVTESLYPTNFARNSISEYFLNRWTPENPTNDFPIGANNSLYGGARAINSWTVVDASFVRIRNITLGYLVPVENIKFISFLRTFISADNLLTITNFKGFDPDASATGDSVSRVNYNSYPLARTFRAGIEVRF
ncbi:MAG: TonB-dependent receptor [Cyclobacteriaceae bacterium]|nr:TonB-dependent receptor [Cyclobacteriaceae bacterium]